MNTVVFSLGTNMGDRLAHLDYAKTSLCNEIGALLKKSSIYESKAWGNTEQAAFLNQVLVFETQKTAKACLESIQKIEYNRKRQRKEHWGPRTLDIDILFYNNDIVVQEALYIPHLFIAKRAFVLVPLAEILNNYIHPVLQQSMTQLLRSCEDNLTVEKVTL